MKQYVATKVNPPFGRDPQSRSRFFSPTQKTNVYDAIVASGTKGLTRKEVSAKVGLAPDRISFYLSELRRAGYISVLGDPTTVAVTMNAEEAALAALLGLENAMVAKFREIKATPEQNKSYVKYTQVKTKALQEPAPGSSPAQIQAQKMEAQVALRMTLIELVKLIY